jgi:phage baseplate assembly protein W
MTPPVNLRFPYQFDGRGRTAEDAEAAYVRGLVEQVLFTSPGERVNRPDFGSGLLQLAFAPNGVELAATTQLLVQGALQQWLGDLIVVETVAVEADDAALRVTVGYVIRRSDVRQLQSFAIATAPGAGGGGGGTP